MRNTPQEIQAAVMAWDLVLIPKLDQGELKRQLISPFNREALAVAALSASDAIKAAIKSHGEVAFVAVLTNIVFFYYESFIDKKDERILYLAELLSSISARLKDNAEVVIGLINQLVPPVVLVPADQSHSTQQSHSSAVAATVSQLHELAVETIQEENDVTYHGADVIQIVDGRNTVQKIELFEELSSSSVDDANAESPVIKSTSSDITARIKPIGSSGARTNTASPIVSPDTTSATTVSTSTGKNSSSIDFFRRVNSTPAIAKSASSDGVSRSQLGVEEKITSSHSGRRRRSRRNTTVVTNKQNVLTSSDTGNSVPKKTTGIFTVFAPPTLPRPPSEPPPAHLLAAARSSSGSNRDSGHQLQRTESDNAAFPLLVSSSRLRTSSRISAKSKDHDDDSEASTSHSSRGSGRQRKQAVNDEDSASRSSSISRKLSGVSTRSFDLNKGGFFVDRISNLDNDLASPLTSDDEKNSDVNSFEPS
jgi:hypothetical protein